MLNTYFSSNLKLMFVSPYFFFSLKDIKGANILVNTKGVVKLADFGCSRKFEETAPNCRSIKGTLWWMAPEVFKQSGYGR